MSDGARCHYCRKVPCECEELGKLTTCPKHSRSFSGFDGECFECVVSWRDALKRQVAELRRELEYAKTFWKSTPSDR